ncbi:MAG: acyl-CoA dehydrogenase family protein [Acidimicrobiales bacterium]
MRSSATRSPARRPTASSRRRPTRSGCPTPGPSPASSGRWALARWTSARTPTTGRSATACVGSAPASTTTTGAAAAPTTGFPWDFYRAMADGGWIGIAIPEEHGGGGRGIVEASLVVEEWRRAAMNGASAIHLSIFGMGPVIHHGSPELQARVLRRLASGELHVFGVTRPDAGTAPRISTRAVLGAGGEEERLVRGRKVWTTKAPLCEGCCCWCAPRHETRSSGPPTA